MVEPVITPYLVRKPAIKPVAPAARQFPLVPASFFGIVLGLSGIASLWRVAHAVWGLPAAIGETLFAIAFSAWVVIASLYALKWLVAPEAAKQEAGNPVQCCFIGLSGVATMLVAQGALPYSRVVAIALYGVGSLITIGFALWRTGLLWRGRRDAGATTAVLYLPVVAGTFVSGLVAAILGWREVGQMAFGTGLFSWLAIEPVLLQRLYTGDPLPPALRPTLGIQLAPPAVGAATYLALGGKADLVSHALIGYALLQALLLIRMAAWIAQAPFAASYWAFTFGATAMAVAAIRVGAQNSGGAVAVLAPILFGAVNILLLAITAGTVGLAVQRRLLPPKP